MSDDVKLSPEDIQEINEKIGEAVEEHAAEEQEVIKNEVTLSSGYVVRSIPVPDGLFMKIYERFPEPKPPMIDRIDGGKTFQEENRDDPNYQNAVDKNRMAIAEGMARIEALKGTEIVTVPEGAFSFEKDKEWMEELDALSIPVPTTSSRSARYIEWFLYRVAPRWEDRGLIQDVRMRMEHLSEEDIAQAEATFPDTD